MTASCKKRGFTLLEVILAVALFALGASTLLGLFAYGAGLASGANLRAEAAASLEFLAADLEERLFPILPDGSIGPPREWIDQPVPGNDRLFYSAKPVFENAPPEAPGLPARVRVDLEVRWREGGNRLALETSLLFTQSVPYGERLRRRFVPGAELLPQPAPSPQATETL